MATTMPVKLQAKCLIAAVAVGLLGMIVCVGAKPAVAQPLPTDPSLVTGQLANGLRYVIKQHSTPPKRAAMWLHLDTGSLNETDRQRGLAHYLEHMAFNGSANFPPGAVVPFFQSMGMTFGRDQNAFTSFHQTTYQLSLPGVQPETIDKGMTFLADILYRLTLPAKEIDEERQIIQEERRRSLSGQQRVMYYVLEHLAPGSLLGKRIPIGTKETIDALRKSDFEDYYRKWYVASNATLLVVADTDPAEIVELIKKHFADAPKVPRPTPQDVGVKPYQESFAIVASDPEVKSERVSFTRLEPLRAPITTVPLLRDRLVLYLATTAFNRRLRDKITSGGTSYLSGSASFGNQVGAIYTADLSGRAKPGKWKAALQELALELQRARLYGLSDREIADAKKEILASYKREVELAPTKEARSLLQRMNQSLADGEPIMSAQQRLEFVEQLLPSLAREEVCKRFADEFDMSVFSVTATLPSSADVPTSDQLLDLARKALAVKPEKEAVVQRPTKLMDKLPVPGDFMELVEHEASHVWSGWLSNNVRVHYRFMDTRKNQVTVSISLLGGELLETAKNRGISQAATIAWVRPATQHLSSSDVRALLTGKNINVGSGLAPGVGGGHGLGGDNMDSINLHVAGSPADLETGMQLAHLLLTEPKVEPVALDQLLTMMRTMLQQVQTNPMMTGMLLAQGAPFPPDVVRTQPVTLEQIDQLASAERVQAWLDDLIGRSPIEVVVVGDLPKARAVALVQRYLGSLPKRPRVTPALLSERRSLDRPKGPRRIEKAIATETPQAFVYAGFYGADGSAVRDARAMTLGTMVLTTRMHDEIREKDQLVYSIGASFQPGMTYPGFGMVVTAAPTDPAKVDKLVDAITALYAGVAKTGVTDKELDVAKKQVAVTLEKKMREPNYWLQQLSRMTFYDRKLDDIVAAPKAYQEITTRFVRDTFARYYAPDKSVVVVVTPAP